MTSVDQYENIKQKYHQASYGLPIQVANASGMMICSKNALNYQVT